MERKAEASGVSVDNLFKAMNEKEKLCQKRHRDKIRENKKRKTVTTAEQRVRNAGMDVPRPKHQNERTDAATEFGASAPVAARMSRLLN